MKEIVVIRGTKRRVTYSPSRQERQRLDALLPLVAEAERRAAKLYGTSSVAHGFVTGRSPVTCAEAHIGRCVTVSVDLKGWFDSVRPDQLPLPPNVLQVITYKGAPRQGLPTSPAACNLAAVPMDSRILWRLKELGVPVVYTRYADDMCVSFDDERQIAAVLMVLREEAERMGWQIADAKTSIQRATAGRRVIVGIAVDTKLQATRASRRKLRAAQHQKHWRQARGLSEWHKCKLPTGKPRAASVGDPYINQLRNTLAAREYALLIDPSITNYTKFHVAKARLDIALS